MQAQQDNKAFLTGSGVEVNPKMDLNNVTILVWCAIGVDATILLLQQPHAADKEGPRVVGAPPGHQEVVRPQVRDVSALGAHEAADIVAVRAGEAADVGKAGGSRDEPVLREDQASSLNVDSSTCNRVRT